MGKEQIRYGYGILSSMVVIETITDVLQFTKKVPLIVILTSYLFLW